MKYYANWKLNKTQKDMKKYFKKFNSYEIKDTDEVCFFVSSCILQSTVKSANVQIGVQNIAQATWGAYTGETSIEQVVECGANFALVGHSERRNLFFESDEIVSIKMQLLQDYDVMAVLCVGENIDEIENKFSILENQIDKALGKRTNLDNIVIAYEPVWAIGSGLTPKSNEIHKTVVHIKKYLNKKYKKAFEVLYGGSVNIGNIQELKKLKGLDGFLIGGASLDPDKFYQIINA